MGERGNIDQRGALSEVLARPMGMVIAMAVGFAAYAVLAFRSGGVDEAFRTLLDQPFGGLLVTVLPLARGRPADERRQLPRTAGKPLVHRSAQPSSQRGRA